MSGRDVRGVIATSCPANGSLCRHKAVHGKVCHGLALLPPASSSQLEPPVGTPMIPFSQRFAFRYNPRIAAARRAWDRHRLGLQAHCHESSRGQRYGRCHHPHNPAPIRALVRCAPGPYLPDLGLARGTVRLVAVTQHYQGRPLLDRFSRSPLAGPGRVGTASLRKCPRDSQF